MQQVRVNRVIALLSGVFVNLIVWGIWYLLTKNVYDTYQKILSSAELIKINVIGLWVPVGFIGVCLFSFASPVVAFITGKRSNVVWGARGLVIANYIAAFFAILGVIVAIYLYQSMTNRLEEQGYSYCRALTKFSATGRHEVYVARPELCVKRPRPQ